MLVELYTALTAFYFLDPLPTTADPCSTIQVVDGSCSLRSTHITEWERTGDVWKGCWEDTTRQWADAWCRDTSNTLVYVSVANPNASSSGCGLPEVTVEQSACWSFRVTIRPRHTSWFITGQDSIHMPTGVPLTLDIDRQWNETVSLAMFPEGNCKHTVHSVPPLADPSCSPDYHARFDWEDINEGWTSLMWSTLLLAFVTATLSNVWLSYPRLSFMSHSLLLGIFVPVVYSLSFSTYVISTVAGLVTPIVVLGLSWCVRTAVLGKRRFRLPSRSQIECIGQALLFSFFQLVMIGVSEGIRAA